MTARWEGQYCFLIDIAVVYFLNGGNWYYFVGNASAASSPTREVNVLPKYGNLTSSIRYRVNW